MVKRQAESIVVVVLSGSCMRKIIFLVVFCFLGCVVVVAIDRSSWRNVRPSLCLFEHNPSDYLVCFFSLPNPSPLASCTAR